VTPTEQDHETAPTWMAAWVAALGELQEVPRKQTANAGTYSYKYAELGDVLSHVRPVLTRHGLAVWQIPEVDQAEVVVTTIVTHTSGDERSFPPLRLPAGPTAQAIGSAITYARRYDLMSILGLATDDDDGATAGTRPDPDPTVLETFNALTGLDPSAQAKLRQLATEHNRKLTQAGLASDPAWLAVVRGVVNARTVDTPESSVMTKIPQEEQLRALLDGHTPDERRRLAAAWAQSHPQPPTDDDDE
jgi:ERF superfamily protein